MYSNSHKQEKDPPLSCSGPTPAGCAMKENSCSADQKEPQRIKACSYKDNNANYKVHTITKTKMKQGNDSFKVTYTFFFPADQH